MLRHVITWTAYNTKKDSYAVPLLPFLSQLIYLFDALLRANLMRQPLLMCGLYWMHNLTHMTAVSAE